jgi:uncharacterized membrane protein YgdD (TMEM256/DUF423 family)
MHKKFFTLAAILGLLAVSIGAFGAHKLREYLKPADMEVFNTGVQYHFYHTFGIFIAAILYKIYHHNNFKWAALLFALGILLFSGSLYALKLTALTSTGETKWLGAITPIGGVCFIAGWACIAFYFILDRKS